MRKIICLIGVSCSGKTTWAKEYMKENKKTYYVSRDAERESLFGVYRQGTPKEEKLITEICNKKIATFLRAGDVIVDNTHLRRKYINDLVKAFPGTDVDFQIMPMLPPAELYKRNLDRAELTGKLIPTKVLDNQMSNFLNLEIPDNIRYRGIKVDPRLLNVYNEDDYGKLPSCVIYDLDGTLSKMNGRSPFSGKDCESDLPDIFLCSLLDTLSRDGVETFIFSGRNSDNGGREATERWLSNNIEGDYTLVMRKPGDQRPDVAIKDEMFNDNIEGKFYPIASFDDRDCMVDYYRAKGIQTYQSYYGNF